MPRVTPQLSGPETKFWIMGCEKSAVHPRLILASQGEATCLRPPGLTRRENKLLSERDILLQQFGVCRYLWVKETGDPALGGEQWNGMTVKEILGGERCSDLDGSSPDWSTKGPVLRACCCLFFFFFFSLFFNLRTE